MPELPEVETVRRGLAAVMEGRRIQQVHVKRHDLRRPVPSDFADRLKGRRLERLGRRGKYLIGECDDGTVLIAHLGMSGRIVIDHATGESEACGRYAYDPGSHAKHEHIVFEVGNGAIIRFSDPRRFGLMVLTDREHLWDHPLLCRLGPEPVDRSFTGNRLASLLEGRNTNIKAALLDQRTVAGIGNIYACEALYAARLSPRRRAATVRGTYADRLASSLRRVLLEAIAAGGSSLRDHVSATGELGYFQHDFKVYGRAGSSCSDCDCKGSIVRIVQGGRSTFYCPSRQR